MLYNYNFSVRKIGRINHTKFHFVDILNLFQQPINMLHFDSGPDGANASNCPNGMKNTT